MSGFVVVYGTPERSQVESMFNKIQHRGPNASGIYSLQRIMMAQNYLQADGVPAEAEIVIPACILTDPTLRICYDGQMGNWKELADDHGAADGSLKEEHLLLQLYREYGTRMFEYLNDAIFAFAISDGNELLAARDLLGIKTLFYGWKDGSLCLASELKSIVEVTNEVYEFPPGHYMNREGQLRRFAALPSTPPEVLRTQLDEITETVRGIIQRSLRNRVDFNCPTGSLLSGGIDSSVITYLASEAYRQRLGKAARLKTFALGVGESNDIQNARIMAEYVNSDHHELIVNLDQILAALPEVIYYLESFDPSLVRSSVSNFLISRYAREHGIHVLLSGEGGDEVFCGYQYLKDFPIEQLFDRQMECIGYLHSNASLRLDRMNQCNSIRVVAPLISGELLNYALSIPLEYKQKPEGNQKIEKWIFRKAFEHILPQTVVWRLKQEFSQGSGCASLLPSYFEDAISDNELAEAQVQYPMIRSKEEFYYFRIFIHCFGSQRAVETVGQWVCL
jgi:asparagine synthase (glutamine-hydrolysing)